GGGDSRSDRSADENGSRRSLEVIGERSMRSLKTMSERSIRSLKAMHRDQIQEHLRFAQELGVVGVSRDRAWRERKTGAADPRGRPPAAAAEGPTHTSKSPIR